MISLWRFAGGFRAVLPLCVALMSCNADPTSLPVPSATGKAPALALTPITDTVRMAEVKGGSYIPFYGSKDTAVRVPDFAMDVYPVTNQQYLNFVRQNPQWRRSAIKRIYADGNYLINWANDTTLAPDMHPDAPVTNVSWFAAEAYCRAVGKELPTVDQWEYAAMADKFVKDARRKESYNQYILSWYEKPATAVNPVGQSLCNFWGIWDLHGLVWEWTSDFNEVMISGESRRDVSNDNALFCGSGSVGANDLMNYAAFMRFAFRGSLKANYCVRNQGFRCIKNKKSER